MAQRKTIGGDRLGSGKKMTVDLKSYERSTHNLSYLWRSTMAAGTLVPFLKEVALPGDTFDIDLDVDIMTHPTVGPLFGSFKIQLDIFQAPIRLYQGQLHNNKLGIGMDMSKVKLPRLEFTTNAPATGLDSGRLSISQINPSSLLSYLGITGAGRKTGGGTGTLKRYFNAVPFLAYWDIYKNYYANKQEEKGAYITAEGTTVTKTVNSVNFKYTGYTETIVPFVGTGSGTPFGIDTSTPNPVIRIPYTGTRPDPEQLYLQNGSGTATTPIIDILGDVSDQTNQLAFSGWTGKPIQFKNWTYVTTQVSANVTPKVGVFDLSNIDTMREDILLATKQTDPFTINGSSPTPYRSTFLTGTDYANAMSTQESLALKTYNSDLFNNWMETEWIDGANGISAITAVDTSSGEFTIDTLNLAKKVYNMLNRIAISGGSYDDWLDAVYTHERARRAESPIYLGGLMKELLFQEVVSNSQGNGTDGSQPLGTIGGRGVVGKNGKGGKITAKIDEPSYLMGIISLTPRIDYSQGNKWDVNLETMDDFHKPALDEIGFQDLITDQMAWWDTTITSGGVKTFKSAGKQPAWINYMTNVNQTKGNFAIQDNEMFMTLNRRYEATSNYEIKDLTTYIDPIKYNHIFAQTSRDAQNFWTQIAVNITARRKMSAKIMPNL